MSALETPQRIEPTRLDETGETINDLVAELAKAASGLGNKLHPKTAQNLASLVRLMNAYYSNLIEGHNTRPKDIERALAGEFDAEDGRRNLQQEAASHVRVQAGIDRLAVEGKLPEPASVDFIKRLHAQFYLDGPASLLRLESAGREVTMRPGEFRSARDPDISVGRHAPPSGEAVPAFMSYFAERYRFDRLGTAGRIVAMAAAHHRFNYIHPFLDGNGRVSRLMSHAMAHQAGIGAHGLWSISRGLARGVESRREYKMMMDYADTPRQGDRDGRGNLSRRALVDFVVWFLKVALDQVGFMSDLFDLNNLARRLRILVERDDALKPEASRLLEEALIRGEIERGDIARVTGLPERSARRLLSAVVDRGLLASDTPKGSLSLRFPAERLDSLFPRLFPET